MNNITSNPSFNGIFYKIKDNENKTRGYLLGAIHNGLIEGTKQPKAFSEPLMKRFAKTNSLIVEVNQLQKRCKDAADDQRKTSFYMDYELVIKASNENKEIKELETLDFQIYITNKVVTHNKQEQIKIENEITAQVLASEKYEKCELLGKKIEQLQEYAKKKDQIGHEILNLRFLRIFEPNEEKEKQIEEKRKQKKEYKNKIKELTQEIIDLQQDEEIIRYRKKIQNIYNEKNKEFTEFMKSIYEISDEAEIEKFIKFGFSPEMAKEYWDDRNVGMVDKINDVLLKVPGRHFIAVGKGHLVGQMGIAALLRAKGWNIEQIKCDSLIF